MGVIAIVNVLSGIVSTIIGLIVSGSGIAFFVKAHQPWAKVLSIPYIIIGIFALWCGIFGPIGIVKTAKLIM